MQILDPAGTVATKCTVAIYDKPTDVTPSSTSTKTPCSVPTTDNNGGGLYNGKLVSMSIAIPSTYTCTVCWWKVRYDLGTVDIRGHRGGYDDLVGGDQGRPRAPRHRVVRPRNVSRSGRPDDLNLYV